MCILKFLGGITITALLPGMQCCFGFIIFLGKGSKQITFGLYCHNSPVSSGQETNVGILSVAA